MKISYNPNRVMMTASPLLYGHFLEHFHRQVYGGVYDPKSPFADEDGFRTDVIDAMKKIKVPIIRWPGGCFVSAYHWKKAVGPVRTPYFDKAWRVEDPNDFGTDEFVKFCRKIGCEPYICTNAGTGTAEEMSDWVEYCNLENEGEFAKQRIANGSPEPHNVKYWSIGNENYGSWEIGAKEADEWGRLVMESAKMMKHIDPTIELSAAAIADLDWNMNILKRCGRRLNWISLHGYWNIMAEDNTFATYEESMACTNMMDDSIKKTRGMLAAFGLEKDIKIAFDEWNLRGWHHPGVHQLEISSDKAYYLGARDLNDRNQDYTMADTVFTGSFLNMLLKNSDIVGMANFAPIINTRGCIFTYDGGLVLRGTYHVFDLFVNHMGQEVLDFWTDEEETMETRHKDGHIENVPILDSVLTRREDGVLAISAINKHPEETRELSFENILGEKKELTAYRMLSVNAPSTESYNDVDHEEIKLTKGEWLPYTEGMSFTIPAHSVNVIELK